MTRAFAVGAMATLAVMLGATPDAAARAAGTPAATASPAPARPIVAFNSNSAGCVVPHIDSYSVDRQSVEVQLTLTARPEPPPKGMICTCREGGYYAAVFPSGHPLAMDTAITTLPRPLKAPIGYPVLLGPPLPWTGRFGFPLARSEGKPYPFYDLDLGCP